MTNFNVSPEVETSFDEQASEDFDVTNLVGVLDVLVQMDLALNGYPTKALHKSNESKAEGKND